jgi:hypothetical protein
LTCAFARFEFFEKCKKGFAFACAVGCAGHCLRGRAVLRDLLPLGARPLRDWGPCTSPRCSTLTRKPAQ